MSKIIEQAKALLRAGLTDANIAEAREQIRREDYARSKEARKPLFERAIKMIRRGQSSTQVDADLHYECEQLGLDSFQIASDARKHLEKIQIEAWEEAIQSFRNGADDLTVIRRLMAHGFSPFDSEQVAFRAKNKAAEVAS